jgi:hypothetical protein
MDINGKFAYYISALVPIVLLVTLTDLSIPSILPEGLSGNHIALAQQSFRTYDYDDQHVSIQVPYDYNELGSGSAWFASFGPSSNSFYPFTIYLDAVPYNGDLTSFTSEYIKSILNSGSFPDLQFGSTTTTSLGNSLANAIVYSYFDSNLGKRTTTMDIITQNPLNSEIDTLTFVGDSELMAQYYAINGITNIASTFRFI